MCSTIFYIQQILFSQYQLPPASAGGIKLVWFLMALAKQHTVFG
ncbi:hypothetical protein [Flavobacterium franklandianum]|nr:hypothetical protein [Flavobacterium franklandianum]